MGGGNNSDTNTINGSNEKASSYGYFFRVDQ